MNRVNHFQLNLAESLDLSSEAGWMQYYRTFWRDMTACVGISENTQWQKWGIDRLIHLPNGRTITIDEKKRTGKWTDFLCEIEMDYGKGEKKVGWTIDKDKRCDFIAYAVTERHACALLPFEILRITATREWKNWEKKTPAKFAKSENKGRVWVTKNIPVDWDLLFFDMRRTMQDCQGRKPIACRDYGEIRGQQMLIFGPPDPISDPGGNAG